MARPSAVEDVGPPEASAAEAAATGAPAGARLRALLTWFGVDPRGDALPLDPDRACGCPGCVRPTLAGEGFCPVHLGLAEAAELPRAAPAHRPRTFRAILLAGLATALGAGLAVAADDLGFGWLGAGAAAATVGSLVARRAERHLVAALLGTAGFFGASILACAAALFAALALLPALLG